MYDQRPYPTEAEATVAEALALERETRRVTAALEASLADDFEPFEEHHPVAHVLREAGAVVELCYRLSAPLVDDPYKPLGVEIQSQALTLFALVRAYAPNVSMDVEDAEHLHGVAAYERLCERLRAIIKHCYCLRDPIGASPYAPLAKQAGEQATKLLARVTGFTPGGPDEKSS